MGIIYGNAAVVRLMAEFTGDIVPDSDGARDLGSSGERWAEVHQDLMYIGATSLTEAELITIKTAGGGGIPPIAGGVVGNLPQIIADGELEDSGVATADVLVAADIAGKMDLVSASPVTGNFLISDAGGQAGESAYNSASFDAAGVAAQFIIDHIAMGVLAHPLTYDAMGTAAGLVGTHESTYNHANYNTAYGWGNHAGLYEPINANLTDIAAISPNLGGLIIWDGSDYVELPVGASGQILQVSASPLGVDWRGHIDPINYIQFDTSYTNGSAPGRLQWHSEDGTLEVGMPGGNVNLQIGQEHLVLCRNTTGTPIPNGSVVYMIDALNDKPLVALADASAPSTTIAIGVATEEIDTFGYVTTAGLVRDMDTSAVAKGNTAFLSDATPGALAPTPPTAPSFKVRVGAVVKSHASEGIMLVFPSTVPRLQSLSDVIGNPGDGQFPVYETASSTYVHQDAFLPTSSRSPHSWQTGDLLVFDGAQFLAVPVGSDSEVLAATGSPVGVEWHDLSEDYPARAEWGQNGFGDRSASTLTWTNTGPDRTISIQPVSGSFDYWIDGVKYTTTGDTRQIGTDEGIHVIYYDGDVLTSVANPNAGQVDQVIRNNAIACIVYWDASTSTALYVGEERHGMSMSPDTHAWLHHTQGLQYLSGLGLNTMDVNGDGDDETAAQFGIDAGAVTDEDIYHPISAVLAATGCPIYYMLGASAEWQKETSAGYSIRTYNGADTTRMAYNQYTGGAWQLTEIANGDFGLCHIFATTEKDTPMISIMGQGDYANLASARSGAETEIHSLVLDDILFPEIKPVATVIFQTRDNYDNAVKSRVRSTDEGDDYVDWRHESVSRVALTTSDHENLSGLLGGAAAAHYHLTTAQHDRVALMPDIVSGRSPDNWVLGDILVFDGAEFQALPIGSDGQVLTASGSPQNVEWATPSGGDIPWENPGDMLYASGSPLDTEILPIGDPDKVLTVNSTGDGVEWADPSLPGSGLAIDGSNWMTGQLQSSDKRLTSRVGLLNDVDDDFASYDASLWTMNGSITYAGGYAELGNGTANLSGNYRLAGDFDVRLLAWASSANYVNNRIFLCCDFDDDVNWNDLPGTDRVSVVCGNNNGTSRGQWSAINSASLAVSWPTNTGSGYTYEALRVTRVGNTFTIYTWFDAKNSGDPADIRLDTGWWQIRSGGFTPSANVDCRIRLLTNAYNASWNEPRALDYYLKSGTIVPGDPTGPAWIVDSHSTIIPNESFIEFYNGTFAGGTLLGKLTTDGVFDAEGGFDVPSSALGDLLVHDGDSFNRMAAGSDGEVFMSTGSPVSVGWGALTADMLPDDSRVHQFPWVITSPATGNYGQVRIPVGATVTRVHANAKGGTVDFNIEERSTLGSAGTNILSADAEADADGVDVTSSFNLSSLTEGRWLTLDVSAVAGSPTVSELTVCVEVQV